MGGLIVEGTIYSNDCKQHLVYSFYQQEHLLKMSPDSRLFG